MITSCRLVETLLVLLRVWELLYSDREPFSTFSSVARLWLQVAEE